MCNSVKFVLQQKNFVSKQFFNCSSDKKNCLEEKNYFQKNYYLTLCDNLTVNRPSDF